MSSSRGVGESNVLFFSGRELKDGGVAGSGRHGRAMDMILRRRPFQDAFCIAFYGKITVRLMP